MNVRNSNYIITPAKVLSDTELASLKALCNRYLDLKRERRNASIILLTLECGLRASEVLGLTLDDVDFSQKTVYIRSLKGSNARLLPARPSLLKAIQANLREDLNTDDLGRLPGETKLFDISYTRLEQIWRMMRPHPKKTLHCLRHTFAVTTFLRTRDIKLVQMALGHRMLQNTMVYVDFIYTQSTMRKALVVGK